MSPNECKIQFDLACNRAGLTITVSLDGINIWQGDPEGQHCIEFVSPDQEGEHQLVIELSGKTADHTRIDEQGQIIEDTVVKITNINFDEILVDQLIYNTAHYDHDFNGTQPPIKDRFFGFMGCNGRLTVDFYTPSYIWLLDNM